MRLPWIHHASILVLYSWWWSIHIMLRLWVLVLLGLLVMLIHEMLLWDLYLDLLHLVVLASSTLILGSIDLRSHGFIPCLVSIIILSLHVSLVKCLILAFVCTQHLLFRHWRLIILFVVEHLPPCLFIQVIKLALYVVCRNSFIVRPPLL